MLRTFLLLVLIPTICLASDLVVKPADHWNPATAGQVALLARQPGMQVVDFSVRDQGGAAFVLKSSDRMSVHPETAESVVDGYIQSITASGQTEITRGNMSIKQLPALQVNSIGHTKLGDTTNVTFFAFSNDRVYTISVLGPPGGVDDAFLLESYLSRIEVPGDLKPGSIDANSDFERGRRFGLILARYKWMFLGVLGLIGICIAVIMKVKSRGESA